MSACRNPHGQSDFAGSEEPNYPALLAVVVRSYDDEPDDSLRRAADTHEQNGQLRLATRLRGVIAGRMALERDGFWVRP